MRTWYTTKPCHPTAKSQISHMVADSSWEQNRAKRAALKTWVDGVNAKGGFGLWAWDVAFQPAQLQDILAKHSSSKD